MHNENIFKLVRAALMAALCLVLTMVLVIPAPTGYVNLGDCGVLLCGWLLGPVYGAMAAGVGTMLADVLSGYAAYAPATFVIKFLMALTAAWLAQTLRVRPVARWLVGAAAAEGIMVVGYFLYESFVLGVGLAAVASVPANLVQGAVSVAAAAALMSALYKAGVPFVKKQ